MLHYKFIKISGKYLNLFCIILFFISTRFSTMAQSNSIIENKTSSHNTIISSKNTKKAADILKSYLDKAFINPFSIQSENGQTIKNTVIYLEIANATHKVVDSSFVIKSDSKDIFLIGSNEKFLRYAVYTLLETWGFRKFSAKETYIPDLKFVTFPKNTEQQHKPAFEYRALLYPDAYDESFRDWHKLDWHLNDFSVWGHSFHILLPPKTYFKTNPDFFALYEGKRRSESLCMTNDTVTKLIIKKMQKSIAENPNAPFYSLSQNDDAIYCECAKCSLLNKKYGGPQGSLYYFLNKIAVHFPKTKIVTLAYQHTFKPPINLKLEPNIYTLFCPIDVNRGKSIVQETKNSAFIKTLENWGKTTSHLYIWDYTVQFSNYLSPFPNLHTFSENFKLFKQNNTKGLFVQGYADVPGDFTELRQYLLAKLLWDTEIDIDATTDDFLRGFYGKAAPFVKKYLTLLTENQEKSDTTLDIYSGPVQKRNAFLSPEAMDQYDQLLDEAILAVSKEPELKSRIHKLRLSLEYVYFEQSKFYGKDMHGMFTINTKNKKQVKKGLNARVEEFAKACTKYGIYELSEGGLSPEKYNKEWLEISKNTVDHIGENMELHFLTPPAEDYKGKGPYGLVDGIRGYKDYNINWIGWYGSNSEIELITKNLKFNELKINFLNNQRHWIFIPKKIILYGYIANEWYLINEKELPPLVEDNTIKSTSVVLNNPKFSSYSKLKIVINNQESLPVWKKRKNKKPMLMIDEIELYHK
jgi:ribosomal protein S8